MRVGYLFFFFFFFIFCFFFFFFLLVVSRICFSVFCSRGSVFL